MSLKIDKDLFDEKVYGGFEFTDPDDETFLLDQLESYPGDLPFENEEIESDDNLLASISAVESNEKRTVEEITSNSISSEFDQQEKGDVLIKDIPVQQENASSEEEIFARPYEKAGIDKEDKERVPYQKSGLVEHEERVPFERSGLERKAEPKITEVSKTTKSIWDIFEDVESQNLVPEATETEETVIESKPEQFQSEFEEQLIIEEPTEEAKKEEEVVTDSASTSQTETVLIESDSIVGIPIEIKVSDVSEEELATVLTKDFRDALLEDLEKSRKKKEQKVAKQEEVISAEEKQILQAQLNEESTAQVEEVSPVEVDLSSIELEKPSQIVAQELIETGELEKKKKKKKKKAKASKEKELEQFVVAKEEEVVGFEKAEEKQKSEELQEDAEEKKKRKIPVFWLALGGGLALLLLFVGGGYLVYRNYFTTNQSKPEIAKKPEQVKKTEHKAKIEKPESTASTTKSEEQISAPSKEEPEKKEDLSLVERKATTPVEPKIEAKDTKEAKEQIPPKFKITPKPSVPKVSTPKYATKQEIKPFVLPKEVKIVETTQEEYSIEIFSTADPEEANYWIIQLQKRGINVYQKVHKIKNVPYYKIRIGTYKSIEEARDFARSLGFRNFWIDRIK